MKKLFVIIFLLLPTCLIYAQTGSGFRKDYRLLKSGNYIIDKNFYILTAISNSLEIQKILRENKYFNTILQEKCELIKKHITDTCKTPNDLLEGFRWSPTDSLQLLSVMKDIYTQYTAAFDKTINNDLRPSGYYQRFTSLTNQEFLLRAWAQYVTGINTIIDEYGLGKKILAPWIDSATYDVKGRYYKRFLKPMFAYMKELTDSAILFYQPSLLIALELMNANDRDEPARHEPLETQDNKKAFEKIKHTQWQKYKYAAILIPGIGPSLTSTPISPLGKIHAELGASRYKNGLAPFIIVSGGYCYPFRGPYSEAVEMKKYLMQKCNIPEDAIIIDPYARHTTTNFRNANRLMIRYGIPMDKPSLCVTSIDQADYIINPDPEETFDQRNMNELGYLPYRSKQRLSSHEIMFFPTLESLHMDPSDPLDP